LASGIAALMLTTLWERRRFSPEELEARRRRSRAVPDYGAILGGGLVVMVVAAIAGGLLQLVPPFWWLQWGAHGELVPPAIREAILWPVGLYWSPVWGMGFLYPPLCVTGVGLGRRLRPGIARDLVSGAGHLVLPLALFAASVPSDGFWGAVRWSFLVWALLGYGGLVGARVLWRHRRQTAIVTPSPLSAG